MVLVLYRLMEIKISIGTILGTTFALLIIYLESTIGQKILEPTVSQMKTLILIAVSSATIGVIIALLLFKPEIK
ncbi:MAG: hypothetical protein BTN85_2006 [Candidatus Methanohalarchaeum thermophilum]|uniref:Uncharacterized protein n=1 Tax=Methanohalarchaeum thermophilum TaxID=1903181 RepID=A0A1Q6DSK9_METT1|nr:MAG: hypothetical protein BTN85_2006 [Candidatus Methanohalarchaeum thermophilum]